MIKSFLKNLLFNAEKLCGNYARKRVKSMLINNIFANNVFIFESFKKNT